MTDQNTDFFAYVDNFAKINGVESVKVFGDEDPSVEYTIAIPTYKRTEYLKEAIDSALNQDYTFSYNIIVVDNNPERGDGTEMMMDSYKNAKNLSYYKNAENIGMGGNWNRLFQLSKTKWVVMLHDDDVLYPFFISRCDELVKKLGEDVGIIKPKEDHEYKPHEKEKGDLKRLYDLDFYYGNSYGTPSGMLFYRDKVIESGGYNQDFYPTLDYCFHVRFASTYSFYFYTEPLMYYRIGVNESIKPSVQKQWLIDASYLIRQLLKRYHVPSYIADGFVARRTMRCHQELQRRWKTKFSLELDEIGLRQVSVIKGILCHEVIILLKSFIKHKV